MTTIPTSPAQTPPTVPELAATIVDVLADLAEAKQLYKGLRSTLWCIHDETALAEAEVEYADHTSPSIWVRFALVSEAAAIDPAAVVFVILFAGVILASVYGLALVARRRASGASKLPLGSFLAAGGLLSALFGPQILAWYMGLLQ